MEERKLMTVHKIFNANNDVNRLHLPRKEGRGEEDSSGVKTVSEWWKIASVGM